jgi:hypothetical protein
VHRFQNMLIDRVLGVASDFDPTRRVGPSQAG